MCQYCHLKRNSASSVVGDGVIAPDVFSCSDSEQVVTEYLSVVILACLSVYTSHIRPVITEVINFLMQQDLVYYCIGYDSTP